MMDKEQELALKEQMEKGQTPEGSMVDKVEYHLGDTDLLLQAVLDVAEVGRQEAEDAESNGRFIVILELLGQYRKRHEAFIESLYRPKEGKAA